MSNLIEIMDGKRRKYLSGYLIFLSIFLVIWFSEKVLQAAGIKIDGIRIVSLPVYIICILFQAYYSISLSTLKKKIKNDPQLNAALYNELVQLNELKSWRTAFFSTSATVLLLSIMSIFTPLLNDTMYIALTSILIGFGSYHLAFFVLDRG
ncbi:hypothetical protein ACFL4T_03805 [candidate division KSB1 bacterium]